MSQGDVKNKFAKILASLPADKKAELYSKLKTLPEKEREKAIQDIVARYDKSSSNGKSPQKKVAVASPYPSQPIASTSITKKSSKGNSKKKRINKRYKRYITLASIAMVLVVSVVILIFSKLDLMGKKKEELISESSVNVETSQTVQETTSATTEVPTPSPTPTPIPDGNEGVDLTGLVIVIDPGHQEITSSGMENCASWIGSEKPRCTSGAVGVSTGVYEYELTLRYSQMIGTYLEQKGATVIYTREENTVDISNQERAQIANDNNADIFLRIHTDAANDSKTSGVMVYIPDTGDYTSSSVSRGERLGNLVAEAEGFEFINLRKTNQYTGLNYANQIPSFQLCLGYLSNSDDETVLISEENMVNVAYAIANFCSEIN